MCYEVATWERGGASYPVPLSAVMNGNHVGKGRIRGRKNCCFSPGAGDAWSPPVDSPKSPTVLQLLLRFDEQSTEAGRGDVYVWRAYRFLHLLRPVQNARSNLWSGKAVSCFETAGQLAAFTPTFKYSSAAQEVTITVSLELCHCWEVLMPPANHRETTHLETDVMLSYRLKNKSGGV